MSVALWLAAAKRRWGLQADLLIAAELCRAGKRRRCSASTASPDDKSGMSWPASQGQRRGGGEHRSQAHTGKSPFGRRSREREDERDHPHGRPPARSPPARNSEGRAGREQESRRPWSGRAGSGSRRTAGPDTPQDRRREGEAVHQRRREQEQRRRSSGAAARGNTAAGAGVIAIIAPGRYASSAHPAGHAPLGRNPPFHSEIPQGGAFPVPEGQWRRSWWRTEPGRRAGRWGKRMRRLVARRSEGTRE